MAKKFTIDLFDKRHLNNMLKRMRSVEAMFDEAVKEAARAGASSGFSDPERPFYFDDFPAVRRKIDELIEQLHKKVVYAIEEGDHEEWLLSCEKNNELVEAMTRSTSIPKAQITQWKQPNLEALAAFQARKTNGLGLSDRVWNITEQFKQELELALDIGLGEGKSAADLTSDVRRCLNEPERLFRRVRDKHGVLRLSKAAKAYHPGQGVYRSSYKNALRLTATENNIAYRTSDYNRWQQLDFVVGIEIRCSNNHPDYDVCDELKGKYPKDFKFTGWHPFCRCNAVPILAKQEEFLEYQRRMLAGEDVADFKFTGTVNDVPNNFGNWIRSNAGKIEKAKNLPYFIKENRELVNDVLLSAPTAKISIVQPSKEVTFDFAEAQKRFIFSDLRGGNFESTVSLDDYKASPIGGIDLVALDDEMNEIFARHNVRNEYFAANIHTMPRNVVFNEDGTVTIKYGRGFTADVYIERVFGRNEDGRVYVDHEYFLVNSKHQGKGFSKEVFRAFYEQYRNTGVELVNVHANIDVGGYCWAKYGFNALNQSNVNRAVQWDKLSRAEASEVRNIINDFYSDKSNGTAFPMIKIASLPYGKKALLNSNWYGNIDLTDAEQRRLFESYLGI